MRTEPVAPTPLAPSSDECEPMQVDRLRRTAKEKQRCLLEGLCLYCAAQGHHAQSWPLKQSRSPQRVNMSGTAISSTHGSRTMLSVSIITKHASFKGSALIDSGAEGNFIDEEWARVRGILFQPLPSTIIAHGFDGPTSDEALADHGLGESPYLGESSGGAQVFGVQVPICPYGFGSPLAHSSWAVNYLGR
ncbi:retrotransposon-derived PEG10 isoform 1 [Labeo rohita]|uniref:Retrotransposon-derived PEG10 isoform 1 n=1 Tax=Labeo rohita TaxID=84645 RepID=A0A498LRY1_LABRO|nr:retrotransposon-derived PEG10 isoform 1 [Labeo rohita]